MLERAKTTNCPFLPLTRESYLQIHESLEELDKACAINDSNSNLYYIKALLFLFLNQCEEGLEGIVNAITKS